MDLIKAGNINNFPEGFEFPAPPEYGVVYRFQLNIAKQHEFKDEYGSSIMVLPRTYTFPVQSQVYDPKTKRAIPIAIVTSKDKDDIPTFQKISFSPSASNGVFAVTGGDVLSNWMYYYLMMASFREREEGDKSGVPNTPILCRLLDSTKAANEKRDNIAAKHEAYNLAKSLSDDELKEKVLALNGDFNAEILEMRAFLEEYADMNPKGFMAIVNSDDTQYKALIKTALGLGAITLKGNEVLLTKGNTKLFDMRTDEPLALGDEFIYFVKTSEIGTNMVSMLKREVDSYAKKKKANENK